MNGSLRQADPDLDGLAVFENGILLSLTALHLEVDGSGRVGQDFYLRDLERIGRALDDHGYRLRPDIDQQDRAFAPGPLRGVRALGYGGLGFCGLVGELFGVIVQLRGALEISQRPLRSAQRAKALAPVQVLLGKLAEKRLAAGGLHLGEDLGFNAGKQEELVVIEEGTLQVALLLVSGRPAAVGSADSVPAGVFQPKAVDDLAVLGDGGIVGT